MPKVLKTYFKHYFNRKLPDAVHGGGGGNCTHVQGTIGEAYYVRSHSFSPSDRPFGLGKSNKPRVFLQVISGRSCRFFCQANRKTCLPDSVYRYWHLSYALIRQQVRHCCQQLCLISFLLGQEINPDTHTKPSDSLSNLEHPQLEIILC